MPEIAQSTLNTLAEMLAEYRCEINRLTNTPTVHEMATARRNAELEKELREFKDIVDELRQRVCDQCEQISELRKEKEHYEMAARNVTKEAQEQAGKIIKLNQELSFLKSDNRYHKGHSAGYAEALAKVQDAILKLRERNILTWLGEIV